MQPKSPLDVRAVCVSCAQPYVRRWGSKETASCRLMLRVATSCHVSVMNFDGVTDVSAASRGSEVAVYGSGEV